MKNFANIAHGSRIYTVNDDYSGEHLMGIEKFPHYGETEYQSIGKRTMRFKKEGAF